MNSALRHASETDIDDLVALELGFPEIDRFPRRTWKRLLAGNTLTLVVDGPSALSAAAVFLFRKGSSVARLYSISVAESARGGGLARVLLTAGEAEALLRGCNVMKLEVRVSNSAAISLYERAGYRIKSRLSTHFPDEEGVRMEKYLT